MKVRSTQLSYIFKALFRDTPLAHSFVIQVPGGRWPGGQAKGGRWHEKNYRALFKIPKFLFNEPADN